MRLPAFVLPVLAAVGLRFVTAGTVVTDNTYVKVIYKGGAVRYFDFGECYPFEINGSIAEEARWLQASTCYARKTFDCSGPDALPIPVTLPQDTILVNAADFAQLVGNSAMCYKPMLLNRGM